MHHRVRVAAIARTAGIIGPVLAVVATALTTAHSSVPDTGPLAFQPVTVAAPGAAASPAASSPPIFEGELQSRVRPKPTVPSITSGARSIVKATPKPVARKPKPVARTVKAAPKPAVPSVATARSYALSRIGSTQFSCLDKLWERESGWNPRAYNSSSGAYGIPQALPGDKMASIASDWRYNPVTQVKWGLGYVAGRYGTACSAWNHSQSYGWY
jgi:resuscitation-promoting factor RpfB